MRAAIAATLLLITVGCGSSQEPEAAPSSAATSTSRPTTTTTTTAAALSASPAVWESELEATSPRTKCQGADAFTSECVIALEKFATTIERLAKTVASSGGKYFDAGLKALEIRDSARRWNEDCVTQSPEVRGKRGCLQDLYAALNGADAIMAEVYAAEQTR